MIARIRGELLEAGDGRVIVDAGGVGYEVLVPESVLATLPPIGERVDLQRRQIFREDSVSLYGFESAFQRRLFDLLNGVKGCGPKTSLGVIGSLGEETTAAAIAGQDTRTLTRASGVGPRLAERIIVELRDLVQQELTTERISGRPVGARPSVGPVADELVDALLALGYRRNEAESAAVEAREQGATVEEQLKIALRSLSR